MFEMLPEHYSYMKKFTDSHLIFRDMLCVAAKRKQVEHQDC